MEKEHEMTRKLHIGGAARETVLYTKERKIVDEASNDEQE